MRGQDVERKKSSICIETNERGVVKARRLMKKMRELCIKAKIEVGQADGNDLNWDKGDNSQNQNNNDNDNNDDNNNNNDKKRKEGDVVYYELESSKKDINE